MQNAFTTPRDPQALTQLQKNRIGRLDGFEDGYSPIDAANWSASGATR
ncbi:hypothetical protein SB861_49790 [Paraburkholderia sp. SIMBA_049]